MDTPRPVDASRARVIGLDPGRVGYLVEAARFLDNADASRIKMRGEALPRFATRVQSPLSVAAAAAVG